jgi:hypothetical protein
MSEVTKIMGKGLRKILVSLGVLGLLLGVVPESAAKKKPKDRLMGDCVYQTISNDILPGAIVPGETYFLSLYVNAPDPTRISGDLYIQVQEWGPGKKPLAAHSWEVPREQLLRQSGSWFRVGQGRTDEPLMFTAVNEAGLQSFTVEFGFDPGAKSGDTVLIDGVQLEKALLFPGKRLAAFPTAYAIRKGIASPCDQWDLSGVLPYYSW